MSKKLLVVLLLFFLVFITTITISLQERETKSFPSFSLSPVTPTPLMESTLSFSQNPIITTRGATTSADILLESRGPLPQTLQLEIEYDPLILTDMSIEPGILFPEAAVTLNKINPFTGRISYAIETSEGTIHEQQSGIIATLVFTPNLTSWQEETYLNFLPKTNIKGQTEANTLQSGYGVRVVIK